MSGTMSAAINVRITEADFDITAAHDALKARAVGAIVTFTGTVRGDDDGADITALTLEHFPGMTEAEITSIIETASERWSLLGVTVIHRVGRLLPEDNIVFVGSVDVFNYTRYSIGCGGNYCDSLRIRAIDQFGKSAF